jgi:hypothetical protein
MLSRAQESFYWRLWAMLRKAQPGVDRHAVHEALGLPASHTEWNGREHFDAWRAHVMAQTRSDLPADEEARRRRHGIGVMLRALGEREDYAEEIVHRMNLHGRLGGAGRTLDSLTGAQLSGVTIALKAECRRRWRTKSALLAELDWVRREADLDEVAARAAVAAELRVSAEAVPDPAGLSYERILPVLAALRGLAGVDAAGRGGDPY